MKKLDNTTNSIVDLIQKEAYQKELGWCQKKKRIEDQERERKHIEDIKILQKKHDQTPTPKSRLTDDELRLLILMVLETGQNGTKVIRIYAEEHGKDKQWCIEVAKPNAGKSFKAVLNEFEEHPLILVMKKRNKYSKKAIIKQTITGALEQLAKQVLNYKDLIYKEEKIDLLMSILLKGPSANKEPNWEDAQKLRDYEVTLRDIAKIFGVSKSTVGKHTTKPIKG